MTSPQTKPIRVMLISDLQIVLWGLEKLVREMQPRLVLAGTTADCLTAAQALADSPVDVMLVDLDGDIRMDEISALCSMSPAKVLALSGSRDIALCDSAILAGARGMLAKTESAEAIVKAIEKVHQGELWIDRSATSRILHHLGEKRIPHYETPDQRKIASLTRRELQTVSEITRDAAASGKQIAERLKISENTLRNHLNSIYAKLGISSRLELFAYAKLHAINNKP
ncbi:LuxR C-terminal-related transcriptional regulator [Sphingorhabdus sp.]|uniref:LuxR C-terminal-related transcriptional regulator n=1 Tax=Sphingorhabdus sp. TaxID=1902408 RepID=UPI0035B15448